MGWALWRFWEIRGGVGERGGGRARESFWRALKNGLARNEMLRSLRPCSNAVAVNCVFHTLFSLSGFSVVKIWFTALLNYNPLNANYFQLSSDQFSELFTGSWQHDKLCYTDARQFQLRSPVSFHWTLTNWRRTNFVKIEAFFVIRLHVIL
jgi:hypothetical protein